MPIKLFMAAAMTLIALSQPARGAGEEVPQDRPGQAESSPAQVSDSGEGGSLHRIAPAQASGPEDRGIGRSQTGSAWGLLQTLGALALVAALILLTRPLLRRLVGAGQAPGRQGPMQVLARMSVSAKQQLLLVRFGDRLVLAGSGPAGLAALSEITDPAEVSRLLGALETSRQGVLGARRREKDEPAEQAAGHRNAGQPNAVREVVERMRRRVTGLEETR